MAKGYAKQPFAPAKKAAAKNPMGTPNVGFKVFKQTPRHLGVTPGLVPGTKVHVHRPKAKPPAKPQGMPKAQPHKYRAPQINRGR